MLGVLVDGGVRLSLLSSLGRFSGLPGFLLLGGRRVGGRGVLDAAGGRVEEGVEGNGVARGRRVGLRG